MSAHADDLRYFYAEHLGDTVEVSASNVTAVTAALSPGKYMVRVRTAAGGAEVAWFRQGSQATVTAAAAVPSTPYVIGGTTTTAADQRLQNGVLFTFMVRGSLDGLAVILDAGTAIVSVTKISRDKN